MNIRSHLSPRPFTLVEHVGFRYLAVIQNGLQIGALAQTPEGQYVQVNGAVVQPLKLHMVQRALEAAGKHPAKYARPEPDTKPVVIVRRRHRVPVQALHG